MHSDIEEEMGKVDCNQCIFCNSFYTTTLSFVISLLPAAVSQSSIPQASHYSNT